MVLHSTASTPIQYRFGGTKAQTPNSHIYNFRVSHPLDSSRTNHIILLLTSRSTHSRSQFSRPAIYFTHSLTYRDTIRDLLIAATLFPYPIQPRRLQTNLPSPGTA